MHSVNLIFVINNKEYKVKANVGSTILDIAKHYELPLEGACGGCLACATCHVVLDKKWYENLKNTKTEIEEDLLEYAIGLDKCSRLGCQIIITKEMEGMIILIPTESRNFNMQGEK